MWNAPHDPPRRSPPRHGRDLGDELLGGEVALRDFPEAAFNAARLLIASAIFIAAIWRAGRRREPGAAEAGALGALTRQDWLRLTALGIVGHMVYQLLFLGGVKRTSVGNAALTSAPRRSSSR